MKEDINHRKNDWKIHLLIFLPTIIFLIVFLCVRVFDLLKPLLFVSFIIVVAVLMYYLKNIGKTLHFKEA